jgi:hypothetical protein
MWLLIKIHLLRKCVQIVMKINNCSINLFLNWKRFRFSNFLLKLENCAIIHCLIKTITKWSDSSFLRVWCEISVVRRILCNFFIINYNVSNSRVAHLDFFHEIIWGCWKVLSNMIFFTKNQFNRLMFRFASTALIFQCKIFLNILIIFMQT